MWHDASMDDKILNNPFPILLEGNPPFKSWLADLTLKFDAKNGRSYLAKNTHIGPLVIQKTLHPEGDAVCHGIIIHPPGGVAGGDVLKLNVHLLQNTQTLLTTPGAGKWYKANGFVASQHLQFNIALQGCLEWFPQENIIFNGADCQFSSLIELDGNACYAGWDILVFGRLAKGERWETGKLKQNLSIHRAGKLIWQEAINLDANHPFFTSPVGINTHVVSASFVIAAEALPTDLLAKCQAIDIDLTKDKQAQFGISALPHIVSARYIGMSAQTARQYFESLWQLLRPWYAKRAVMRPRIWNT